MPTTTTTTTASTALPPDYTASVAAAGQSPTASDSEEYEYEEVEIEEEVEVEVSDEEVNEEDAQEESGEDLSTPIDEEDHGKGKRTPVDDGDMLYNARAPECDGGMTSAETGIPFNVSGKEVKVSEESKAEGLNKDNKSPHSEAETKAACAQDVNDKQEKQPRLDVPLIRSRSLSPGVETKEGSKRPVLACEFFAKGWCIKGNSCRFVHVREPMNLSNYPQEASVAVASQNYELQDDQGSGKGARRSRFAGLPASATSAAAPNTPSPSKMTHLQEPREITRWKVKNEELHKENPISVSLFDDVGRVCLRENQDKDNSPANADGSLHRTFSSSPFKGVDISRSNRVSSYATNLEELGGGRNQFGLHDRITPIFSNSLYTSSNSPQLPSNRSSAWTRSSTLFSCSSWNSDSFGTPKHLDSDREPHVSRPASLQPSASPFSASESDHLYQTNVTGDLLHSAGYAMRFSTFDWEPSKPFRSSFLLSQGLSPCSLYDPIRDSIEQPKFGVGFSKFSSSSQGPSVSSTHLPTNVNPPVNGTYDVDYGSDRHSLTNHDKSVDANSNVCDLFTSEIGAVATKQEKTISAEKENKHLTLAFIGDVVQGSELHGNHNFVLQNAGPTKKEIKVGDETSQNYKLDIESKGDGVIHRESKAVKHFRAALIEFVKEMVKPAWREGNLTKDAHKLIVKKAVDKVLSTLPAENIPSTQDSVDLYLSSCQPKLAKLVEGYIDKYGKS